MQILIFLIFILNYYLLYKRKNNFVKSYKKWILVAFLAILCPILGLVFSNRLQNKDLFGIQILYTPLIFSIVESFFIFLSYSIQKRDFKLFLRGTTRNSNGKKIRFSTTDKILSVVLLFTLTFLQLFIFAL